MFQSIFQWCVYTVSDERNGTCFNVFSNGVCSDPRRSPVTVRPMQIKKDVCCCTRGGGWGSNPCEVCPREGEREYISTRPW